MNRTSIEWTDFTANPLKYRNAYGHVVWGCAKVSAGCTHCYAEALAQRYRRGGPFNAAEMAHLTPYLDGAELRRMLTYKPAAGQRCFVGDMTDIFGEWVPDEMIAALFGVMAARPDVTFQLLTKRPHRMREWFDWISRVGPSIHSLGAARGVRWYAWVLGGRLGADWETAVSPSWSGSAPSWRWPLPNVWLGVSAENQAALEERLPHLLETPAAIRFVSAEPLLGPIDLTADALYRDVPCCGRDWCEYCAGTGTRRGLPIHWVIVGGESGQAARPCDVAWIRDVVSQAAEGDVPVFVKQLGTRPHASGNRLRLCDRKGGTPGEWPADLRERQFPVTSQEVE